VLPSASFGGDWATCNAGGGYGAWDKSPDTCRVSWDGVVQACTPETRDATFTVGVNGLTTDMITIVHLEGVADTMDSFEIKDGDAVICGYNATGVQDSEIWHTLDCPVSISGEKTLTFHPIAEGPWALCDTYGQVAVQSITYAASAPPIPEFGMVVAGLVMVAGIGLVVFRRK
jgi:hypothetical protein